MLAPKCAKLFGVVVFWLLCATLSNAYAEPLNKRQNNTQNNPLTDGPANPATEVTGQTSKIASQVAFYYDSKYVTEGRDNLERGGLFIAEGSVELSAGFSTGIWHAQSHSGANYYETQYTAQYATDLGAASLDVGFTHLRFNRTATDNEFNIALSSNNLPLDLAAEYVYSTEANGGFLELSASDDYPLSEDLALYATGLVGIDYGLASTEYDGLNNYQFTLGLRKNISAGLHFELYVAHSIAGEDVKRDGLNDLTWGGLSLGMEF